MCFFGAFILCPWRFSKKCSMLLGWSFYRHFSIGFCIGYKKNDKKRVIEPLQNTNKKHMKFIGITPPPPLAHGQGVGTQVDNCTPLPPRGSRWLLPSTERRVKCATRSLPPPPLGGPGGAGPTGPLQFHHLLRPRPHGCQASQGHQSGTMSPPPQPRGAPTPLAAFTV